MVGIVIVSHSAKLAEGVRDLARQMAGGQAALAVAGGIDDPENPIGTDVMKVYAAIEAVYSPDGVLVLMDLGSAILSAETAVELLPPEQQAHVYLCAAPLVEGTLAAAVQASLGGDIQQVLYEARSALQPKTGQLELPAGQEARPPAPPIEGAQELRLTVRNRLGLHARPAANFVKAANQFQAEIRVSKGHKSANGKSINQVATLGVRQGEEITILAAGPDAAKALAALKTLAGNNFGEPDGPLEAQPVPAEPRQPIISTPAEMVGIPASPGIAVGPAVHYRRKLPAVVAKKVTDVAAEWAKLQAAIAGAQQELKTVQIRAARQVGAAKAAIFEAHQLILQDPILLEAAHSLILKQQLNAEAAWQQIIEATAGDYRLLDDQYMRGRAADVLDAGQRVLRRLLDVETPLLDLCEPSILIAPDLTPSDTAHLDPARVLGICTELGGPTSHSAILAQALGIPAIVGLNGLIENVAEGQMIGLDGGTGQLWLQLMAQELNQLAARRQAWQQQQQQARKNAQQPAMTQDGKRIEVAANIGGPHDAAIALEFGAEGVGLFRTEFLFMGRETVPAEEEQFVTYRQAIQVMRNRPFIIRTLDVGGDKPLPYLDLGQEANPFLGWRGIRLCLDQPDLFKSHLRAILRAGFGYNTKLMFPMIGTLDELRAARRMVAEAQTELRTASIPFAEKMEIGIMIEVPSAVAIAGQLAAEADFFSIGSNDLAQYVMAADRGNSKVMNLTNALQPAVLRLIQQTVQAAHTAGIRVGLCGELAGNALAAPLLVGLDLDTLSMSAPNIPGVKTAIRRLTMKQAHHIAHEVLSLETAQAVQDYLKSIF